MSVWVSPLTNLSAMEAMRGKVLLQMTHVLQLYDEGASVVGGVGMVIKDNRHLCMHAKFCFSQRQRLEES